MRITDLQVDGFGVWKALTVDSLPGEMTVFFGKNEAGKTTLMQFVRSMLFGFSAERIERYIPPVYGGLGGGSMMVDAALGTYEVQRHIDPNRLSDPVGDLAVTDEQGVVTGRGQLGTLLSSIDEPIYNNVFAIGLREIQELGTLNSTEAAEHLYKLTSGLDRVSLVDVINDVNEKRRDLWPEKDGLVSVLGDLLKKRIKLQREIDELISRSRRWSKVAAQTHDIGQQIELIKEQLEAQNKQARLAELALQVADRWRSRGLIDEQIAALGVLPDARDVSIEELEKINGDINQTKERITQLEHNRDEVKEAAKKLPINRVLWSQAARVDALTEHMPWIESLQRQVDRLRVQIGDVESQVGGEVEALGTKLKINDPKIRDLPKRDWQSIRSSGKKLVETRDRYRRAKDELETYEFEVTEHEERLQATLAERGENLTQSLDDTGQLVNRLKRRLELEQKIERLNKNRKDLERDLDEVVENQALPVGKLVLIGCVFVFGVLLMGMGIWAGATGDNEIFFGLGMSTIFLGAAAGITAFTMKYYWDRVAREELTEFRHQYDLVREQVRRAKTERDEIEKSLPRNVKHWDLELQNAETRMSRLEDMLPMENRYKAARQRAEESKRRVARIKVDVDAAEEKWTESLKTAGLPTSLTPQNLKDISSKSDRIGLLDLRSQQLNQELEERETELRSLTKRIDSVLEESGLEFTGRNVSERLDQLIVALNEQRRLVGQRKELAARHRAYKSKLNAATRELDKFLGVKARLLGRVGADSEDQYRSFHLKHQQRLSLEQKREGLTDQISAALGVHTSEDEVGHLLDGYGQGGLERRWEQIETEISSLKEQQSKLHQQRGEYYQEMKTLGEDTRLDEARLELSALNTEIKQKSHRWQVLATTGVMFESMRESYEAQRQPETLKEASTYMEQLTDGQYVRIWTRLEGQELLIDNHEDETLSVDLLSRGTREAVYLSLRLALIGAYARRGAVLPMVLDDVLVNFDAERAKSAARVLRDFAQNGYQVLMFTCHEHVRDLFASLETDVRILPHHRDVLEHDAVPEPYSLDNEYEEEEEELEEEVLEYEEPVDEDVEEEEEYEEDEVEEELEPVVVRAELDDELEFELHAVTEDQTRQQQLSREIRIDRHEKSTPIDLTDDEMWEDEQQKSA